MSDTQLTPYGRWSPSQYDTKGLDLPEHQEWLVSPIGHNRDSDECAESNWAYQATQLEEIDPEGEDHMVGDFGHWACGWFEVVLVRPGSPAHDLVRNLAERLDNYPLLDEDDFSERERESADLIWRDCYTPTERIAYMRAHPNQFDDLRSFADMLGCARGHYFAGWASEIVR